MLSKLSTIETRYVIVATGDGVMPIYTRWETWMLLWVSVDILPHLKLEELTLEVGEEEPLAAENED